MKTALLVVDVQTSLVVDETPNPEEILAIIAALVNTARAAGAPVVWVTDTRVAPDASLHSALQPEAGDLHSSKSVRDAFAGTDLDARLRALGVDTLVICGMQSDACVDGTTRGAAENGFAVVLAADAHTTHAFDGRDWRNVIATQNLKLGQIAGVTTCNSSAISFAS